MSRAAGRKSQGEVVVKNGSGLTHPRGPLLACLLLAAPSAPAAAQSIPPDSLVRSIIRARVDTGRYAGVAVGFVARDGRQQVTVYGPAAGVTPFDANTVFEIGSITKTFTAAILADMVARKELALDDPVATHLPPGTKIPERDGRQITLLDLATQTSGLPRLPANMVITDARNPYASYTAALMYEFLAGYRLPRGIGQQYEYSNLGMGLLGQALAHRAEKDFETLVSERVLGPLGMRDTRIALTPALRARLAPGHNEGGDVVGLWDLPAIAGAGALRSTVGDMLKYVRANVDSTSKPLGSVLATTHVRRRPGPVPQVSIGLAWHRSPTPGGRTIVWHNGGTGGYRSFAGFDESSGLGVVVLANSAVSVDDIAMHLLDPSVPLAPILRRRIAIDLAPEILRRYIGEYVLAPTFSITISLEGGALYAVATGQPKLPIFAESDSEFFLKAPDAQLTFTKDSTGAVTGLVLHQNGQNIPGRRK
jgi:CubicO group peptidase (beta-lactamase class C family)